MNNKIKVAIIIDQLEFGGAEKQVFELASGLSTNEVYEPVVICYSNLLEPFGKQLIEAGITVIYPQKALESVFHKILWLKNILKRYHCKIAYSMLNTPNIYCSLVCVASETRFIASIRGIPHLNWPLKIGLRLSFKIAARIIANSESGKRWAVKNHGAKPWKIDVVPNAVIPLFYSEDARNKVRNNIGINKKDKVVGTIANLKSEKQPDLFLNVATNIIKNNKYNTHFIWVGNGPLWEDIKKKYNELPVNVKSKIHFVGEQPNIAEWLSVFDIFILTSAWEGLPNSLMEAMSLGIPCLATNVEGTCDLISDGYNGVLAPSDVNGFTNKLLELLDDNFLQKKLEQNAREDMLAKYGRNRLIEKTIQVFESVNQ